MSFFPAWLQFPFGSGAPQCVNHAADKVKQSDSSGADTETHTHTHTHTDTHTHTHTQTVTDGGVTLPRYPPARY